MSGPGPGYHMGPFGKFEDTSYKLPPPRVSTSLKFGADLSSRTENLGGKDIGSQKPEQLPSLSQIFTPQAPSGPSHSQAYAPLTPSIERRESAHIFPHRDSGFSVKPHDRAKCRSESLPRAPTTGLPPLSQVVSHGHSDLSHHTPTGGDPSTAAFPRNKLSQRTTSRYDHVPGREFPSPDGSTRPPSTTVRPAVVDERLIVGEGLCFIYADGSYCPQTIDGTPVNANWGVTKAGRPRKRLALACLTCREKKIKCNPATEAMCDQCRKSGRECRFESAPRGNRAMRGSIGLSGRVELYDPTSHAPDGSSPLYNVTRASRSLTPLPGTSDQSPTSDGSTLTLSGQEAMQEPTTDTNLSCRSHRILPPLPGAVDAIGQASLDIENNRSPEYSEILDELNDSNLDDPIMASWHLDPYEVDPETTMHYTECYFLHVNNGLYHMFPHGRFPFWLKSYPDKSADDKMLLYSMMALGCVFSNRPDRLVAMKQYAGIARFAINQSQHAFSLQLAQSYIIMSLWYYAAGSSVRSWDAIGAAGRAVLGLRYNMESGGVANKNQKNDYGLHPQALIECRRRTFWIAFVLDRFSTLYSASSIFISSDVALLRLPCREEIYEAQQYATVPYLHSFLNYPSASRENNRSTLSAMAFMIEIMAIWGDVSLHVTRLPQVPPELYNQHSEDYASSIVEQVKSWIRQLPEYLVFSSVNMERNIRQRNADTFISIHLFHHAILMKIYRHARYQSLTPEALVQRIHRARYHAIEIVYIALTFNQYSEEIRSVRPAPGSSASQLCPLNPFLGYLILSAVDVLGAAGLASQLQESISYTRNALETLQELSRHWDSSLQLVTVLQHRLALMIDCLNERSVIEEKQGFALEGPSLESKAHAGASHSHPPFSSSEDLFSGSMPKVMLLNSLRVEENLISASSIAWMRDP